MADGHSSDLTYVFLHGVYHSGLSPGVCFLFVVRSDQEVMYEFNCSFPYAHFHRIGLHGLCPLGGNV